MNDLQTHDCSHCLDRPDRMTCRDKKKYVFGSVFILQGRSCLFSEFRVFLVGAFLYDAHACSRRALQPIAGI